MIVGLASWGVTEFELFLSIVECKKRWSKVPSLVNFDACKRKCFCFKLQGTIDWNDKTFRDLLAMIT